MIGMNFVYFSEKDFANIWRINQIRIKHPDRWIRVVKDTIVTAQ